MAPLLREDASQDEIDLTSVGLSHYRLSRVKQQDLKLVKEVAQVLYGPTDVGSGKPRSKQEQWLSEIIARLNELFITDGLTDQDLINYAYTIRDNVRVMDQIANNSPSRQC